MRHVKRVTVAKAQFFEGGDTNTVTFWAWVGSIVWFVKEYNSF